MNPQADPIASQLSTRGLLLQKLLYNSGICMVYTVVDSKKSLPAVLKLQRFSVTGRPGIPQRETDNQWKCQHPSIVQLYDCFWFPLNDSFWIGAIEVEQMQKDVARDILDRKANQYPYTEQQLFVFVDSMVEALSFAQELKIAHRDVKPHNIFLSQETYKIGDFGSSKELTDTEEMQSIAGTPSYLSPILRMKMWDREKYASHNPFKSDVYSLGLTFLHMATLCPVQAGGNWAELVEEQIASLRYSENMKNCLRWMLATEEKDRPDFVTMRSYMKPVENTAIITVENVPDDTQSELNENLTESLMLNRSLKRLSPEDLNQGRRGGYSGEYSDKCAHLVNNPSLHPIQTVCKHLICRDCVINQLHDTLEAFQLECPVCGEVQEYFLRAQRSSLHTDIGPKSCARCGKIAQLVEVDQQSYCLQCVEQLHGSGKVSSNGFIDALMQSYRSEE